MSIKSTTANRAASFAAVAGVALLVTACGGGGSGSSSASSGSSASPSGGASSTIELRTAHNADGTYLTDSSGRALYLWVADHNDASTCKGACAQAWPPLTTKGAPAASGTVVAGDLGTITRSGGGTQVTYKGHPLYYYAGDGGPGQTAGQGSDGFGAKWWLVSPAGAAITAGGSGGSGSGSSSGGSGSYSSGGGY